MIKILKNIFNPVKRFFNYWKQVQYVECLAYGTNEEDRKRLCMSKSIAGTIVGFRIYYSKESDKYRVEMSDINKGSDTIQITDPDIIALITKCFVGSERITHVPVFVNPYNSIRCKFELW